MAIALVASQQATVNMTASSTTLTPAPPSNFTAGNGGLLFLFATTGSVVGTPLASSVLGGGFTNGPANWTRLGTVWSAAGGPTVEVWAAADGGGGSKTITVTLAASMTAGCYLTELSGVGHSIEAMIANVVTNQNTSGTSVNVTSGAFEIGDMLFVGSAASSTETASPGGGWTTIVGPTTAGAQQNGLAWQIPAGTNNLSAPWTQTSGNWGALAVVLRPLPSEVTSDAYAVTSGNASAVAANAVATVADLAANVRQIMVIGDPGEDQARVYGGALATAASYSSASQFSPNTKTAVVTARPGDNLLILTVPIATDRWVNVTGVTSGASYFAGPPPFSGILECNINPAVDMQYVVAWTATFISGNWYANTGFAPLPTQMLVRADGRPLPIGMHAVQGSLAAANGPANVVGAPGTALRTFILYMQLDNETANTQIQILGTIGGSASVLFNMRGIGSITIAPPSGLLLDLNTAVTLSGGGAPTGQCTVVYDTVT